MNFDPRDTPETAQVTLKAYVDDLRAELDALKRRVAVIEEALRRFCNEGR